MMVDVLFRIPINCNSCLITIFISYFTRTGGDTRLVNLIKSINWTRRYTVEFFVHKGCSWTFINAYIMTFLELFITVFDRACLEASSIKDLFSIRWTFCDAFITIYEEICRTLLHALIRISPELHDMSRCQIIISISCFIRTGGDTCPVYIVKSNGWTPVYTVEVMH